MTQNAKGPAEAATSPSRGSTNPQKDKEMNRTNGSTLASANSTGAAGEPDLRDLISAAGTAIDRCRHLQQLIFMTAEALVRTDRKTANAITEGCDVIDDILEDAATLLETAGDAARRVSV